MSQNIIIGIRGGTRNPRENVVLYFILVGESESVYPGLDTDQNSPKLGFNSCKFDFKKTST